MVKKKKKNGERNNIPVDFEGYWSKKKKKKKIIYKKIKRRNSRPRIESGIILQQFCIERASLSASAAQIHSVFIVH